jgi:hypothetical protein
MAISTAYDNAKAPALLNDLPVTRAWMSVMSMRSTRQACVASSASVAAGSAIGQAQIAATSIARCWNVRHLDARVWLLARLSFMKSVSGQNRQSTATSDRRTIVETNMKVTYLERLAGRPSSSPGRPRATRSIEAAVVGHGAPSRLSTR